MQFFSFILFNLFLIFIVCLFVYLFVFEFLFFCLIGKYFLKNKSECKQKLIQVHIRNSAFIDVCRQYQHVHGRVAARGNKRHTVYCEVKSSEKK